MRVLAALLATTLLAAGETAPTQPADVPGFVPPAADEHPRLFFRPADVARLRERAQTPEGQAILKRLRATLDGGDGTTFPSVLQTQKAAYENKST